MKNLHDGNENTNLINRGIAGLAMVAMAFCLLLSAPAFGAIADIEDDRITTAIESELMFDEGVSAHLIDVDTEDGVVTLSGQVDNLLASRRAVQIARATKGVRAVVNNIDVNAPDRTDRDLRDDVTAALAADPATDSYEVTVLVVDGVVTLEGSVNSWDERRLCETVAAGVRGVTGIQNKILVQYETDRADTEIRPEIIRRLENDVLVDSSLIDVKVDDGEVTLTGAVGSAEERARARADSWVAGVKSVDTEELKVRWWAEDESVRYDRYVDLDDEGIEEAVRDALVYDPRVLSFKPEVHAKAGVVTLRGQVDSLAAKRAAGQTARNTVGVWRVHNLIRVRNAEQPADKTIADNLAEALKRNAYVERHQIDVSVRNGKAYLSGVVDTQFERQQAAGVASTVKGVIDVDNNLTVHEDWPYKSDREIAQNINSQLYWSPYVNTDQIEVSVTDGTATLTGTVDSWFDRRKAAENAWEGGARTVINKIQVRYEQEYRYRYQGIW